MEPLRLEVFLEERARSLEELIAWKEKADMAGAEAAALRQSCERHVSRFLNDKAVRALFVVLELSSSFTSLHN